jgi:hypothetical protein
MADKLIVVAGLVAGSARLPGTNQENQVITNYGPSVAYLGASALVNFMTGCPLPVNSPFKLYKNATQLYACTGPNSNTPSSLTPAVPASGTPQNNTSGVPVVVTLSGGTITAVAISGVTQSVNGSNTIAGSFVVPAGGSITLTYSVAPTWVWQWGQVANLLLSPGVQAT